MTNQIFFLFSSSLDGDLALEDSKFAAYLAANNWSGEVGADDQIRQVDSFAEKGEKEVVEEESVATVVPAL